MDTKTNTEIITAKPAQENPVAVFLASLESPISRISQLSALNIIARRLGAPGAYSFDWANLRYEHLTAIQAWLSKNYKPKSVRRYMAGVKGVLKAAWKMRLITAEDYLRATSIKGVKGDSLPGRMLTNDEIGALLATCQIGPRRRGMRDKAIISLLAGCGLRRAEVCTLRLSDWNPVTGQLVIHGKGKKERYAYPQGGIRLALEEWLKERGNELGPLFYVIVKSDLPQHKPMNNGSIWKMLKLRGAQAELRTFTPHDLRRTFASNMLDLPGVDLVTTSKLMGHSTPAVTARYDRRSERAAEKAAGMIDIPFEKRGEL